MFYGWLRGDIILNNFKEHTKIFGLRKGYSLYHNIVLYYKDDTPYHHGALGHPTYHWMHTKEQ